MVVIAVIAILAGLLLPALGRAKAKAQTIQCLNNLRQLQLAWYLYAGDHNDRIAQNYWDRDAGKFPGTGSWVAGIMTYDSDPDNTNTLNLVPGKYGSIGAYSISPAIYKCPADKSWAEIGGQGHPRVRSVSMNCYMNSLTIGDNAFWYVFRKTTDIVSPSPSQGFVFLDEFEDSISDGYYFVSMASEWPNTGWVDVVASRHSGRGTFSFADGHVESKNWLDPRTRMPVQRQRFWSGIQSPENKDVLWVQERTTSKKPDAP
jgi:prepilin-type processing-associated H-X9-DG protein